MGMMRMREMFAVDLDGTGVLAVIVAVDFDFVFKDTFEMMQIVAGIPHIARSQAINNRSFVFVVMDLGENISNDCVRRDQIGEVLTDGPREHQYKQGAH